MQFRDSTPTSHTHRAAVEKRKGDKKQKKEKGKIFYNKKKK